MARPEKTGFEYFPHDCDAAYDEKMEALCVLYGHHVAYSTIFRLYERIYRAGGKLDISAPETMRILCRNVAKMTLPHFEKFLKDCQSFEIFDKSLYEEAKLLTSRGILKRIEPIVNKRIRMKELYDKSRNTKTVVSAEETPAETMAETRQRKVKESKVKDITTVVDGAGAPQPMTDKDSKKPPSKVDPAHRAINLFLTKYTELTGKEYVITSWPKQTINMKRVIAVIGPVEFKKCLENYFDSPQGDNKSYSLDFFIASINNWRPAKDE